MVMGLVLLVGTILTVQYFSLSTSSTQPLTPSTQSLPLPDKPSIIVLPFVNMSKDPDQEYFSDGLTEVLTGALSKISSLFVISRNSAFTYKGKAVKVQDVSKEMGVRYVLEGSVQRANQRIRIAVQLIDATTGYHVWSEQYDQALAEMERAVALAPSEALSHAGRAVVLSYMSRTGDALQAAAQAQRLQSALADYQLGIVGTVYAVAGHYEEARDPLQR